MGELASREQLRASYLRWALVTVPLIVGIGFLMGTLSNSGNDNAWFAALRKSPLQPPGIVFPIAWSLLYTLQGLALAMILNARGARGRGLAIGLFVAQLLVNFTWSPVFFGMRQATAGLAIIVVLLLLASATVWAFSKVRPLAAWLLAPYLAWLVLACVLNYDVVRLNPGADGVAARGASTQIEIRR